MTNLTDQLNTMKNALEDFINKNAGKSKHESKFQTSLNKIKNLLNVLKAEEIENFLNNLDEAADELKRATAKIQTAIDNIKNSDKILEKTANIVTTVGKLANAIQNKNPQNNGIAIEELLNIS